LRRGGIDSAASGRELFEDLLRLNFDFVTYRKGPYAPLPESEFQQVTFDVAGQPPGTMSWRRRRSSSKAGLVCG
jgi:hypothetical protein